jgi:hypothetical protein
VHGGKSRWDGTKQTPARCRRVLILAGILAIGIVPPLLMDRLRKPGWKAVGDG